MIKLDKDICTNFSASTSREWLETNGIGGYAMGTVSGANTRRYHSLLTAATKPPLGRIRTVSKIDETLVLGSERFEISSNQFPGTVNPEGYKFLTEFRLDPFPIWTFQIDDIVLEKKLFMVYGSNTTVCRWRLRGKTSGDASLEIRPLLSFVDYHHLQHEDAPFDSEFSVEDGFISVQPCADMPSVHFAHNADGVEKAGYWYRDFEYAIERERGFDFHEDLFQPFMLKFDLAESADLLISTEFVDAKDTSKLERAETKRRKGLTSKTGKENDFVSQLVLAADQFIVARGDGQTIIAGYPWVTDWGRDTFIALPGLTLATDRPEIARGIILEFSKHISEGMLPNRFPDAGETAEFNTVDATLWYFESLRAYVEETGDKSLVEQLYSKLSEIITWHLRGTRYGISVDTDGLLVAGEPGVQLTWMDAKFGDEVFTPRTGKAVEIQSLWYNALCVMTEFAQELGHDEDARKFKSMAELAKLSFNALFWSEEDKCLYDVVCDGSVDASVRPNQILAVSLKHSILDEPRACAVVEKVESELLTPVGLRSLSPRDPKYVPYYRGTPYERDSSYHQGTVWAWLIGPFIDAYRRVYPECPDRVVEMINGFREHLSQAGLGQISEIFDADWPHTPRGCPAQAWSVGELLRVLNEPNDRSFE
jgi:predicted glycogen debranching enzyme